ncbi:MAG TPA: NAD kinase [Actinomycetota bacterium]|nr:NAD kinase [Actinomycetota bacterium]
MKPPRKVLLLVHPERAAALEMATQCASGLQNHGITVFCLDGLVAGQGVIPDDGSTVVDLVVVFGGDGSILRGSEIARAHDVPLLGVNLGHVGFLAELEEEEAGDIVEHIATGAFIIQERMTLDVSVVRGGSVVAESWALNEASIEKAGRMIHVVAEVDGRPLSEWGCDGVLVATPTGSTGYAWSAGGPVVWPTVDAILLVPVSAHALFARPMVVSSARLLAIEVLPSSPPAALWCDGRRLTPLEPGDRIEVVRGKRPVHLARLRESLFVDRLVAKFRLPVQGWSGRGRR